MTTENEVHKYLLEKEPKKLNKYSMRKIKTKIIWQPSQAVNRTPIKSEKSNQMKN